MERLLTARDTTTDDDYYELLGCDETSSAEQISTEFKLLARRYHPDKAPSDDKIAAERMFVRLEKAKETLLDAEKRSKYDCWRRGGFREVVGFEEWLGMQNRVHTSMHWAEPQRPVPSLLPDSSTHRDSTSDANSRSPGKEGGSPALSTIEDFRRGGPEGQGGHISKFRNYGL